VAARQDCYRILLEPQFFLKKIDSLVCSTQRRTLSRVDSFGKACINVCRVFSSMQRLLGITRIRTAVSTGSPESIRRTISSQKPGRY